MNGTKILGMSKARFLVANAIIVLLVINSLLDIVIDKEHWPFSPYPMYSEMEREYSLSSTRLYGVTQEQPHHEIPLYDFSYIQPFDQIRLATALDRLASEDSIETKQTGSLAAALEGQITFKVEREK